MEVGFIGAGRMATTMARHFIGAGHRSLLSSSRGPEAASQAVADLGPRARSGTRHQAAACDLTILACNWASMPEALSGIDWTGRVLVDGTNAHQGVTPDISGAGVRRSVAVLGGRSSSEIVAGLAAGARVVKAISHMPMNWIQDFSADKPRTAMFLSGDHAEAKALVARLFEEIGMVPIDLGTLAAGGALQQLGGPLSAIELQVGRRIVR